MSSNLPPSPPPSPGWGEPVADYLVAGAGSPKPGPSRKGRRIAAIGGGIGLVVLAGGGVWAWNFWFSQGPQPAEALPASTLAYVSVDLDPSGEQQIEAVETLRKFSVIEEQFDFDLDARDDIKKWLFEEVQDEEAVCTDLDYDGDLKPWLGDRFAFAVVEVDDEPEPVVVVQVKDADQAADGIGALLDCGLSGGDELRGWAVEGEWMVLAETEDVANQVISNAKDAPLSEDADFEKWTEATGDPGFVTLYAAPEAGKALLEEFDGFGYFAPGMMGNPLYFLWFGMTAPVGGGDFAYEEQALPVPTETERPSEMGEGSYEGSYEESSATFEQSAYTAAKKDFAGPEIPDDVRQMLEDFEGGAGTIRFDDGDFEVEFAIDKLPGSFTGFTENGEASDVLASLPDTTAAALGVGFADGWVGELVDQLSAMAGDFGMDPDEAVADFEQATGLSVPEDVEALGGDSAALAFDSEVDPSAFEDEDITRVPVGLVIEGDPDAIEAALEKLRVSLGGDGELLLSRTEGDRVFVSADADYLDRLVAGGDLGDSDTYQGIVENEADAATLFFVDFDAGDGWLEDLVSSFGEDELVENVRPLRALGVMTWHDDDAEHTLVKLTTE